MAPKKEKGGPASTNSKAWEPSLIAAHFNQVSESRSSPPPPDPPFQTPGCPSENLTWYLSPGLVLSDCKTQGPLCKECLTAWVLRKNEGSQCQFKQSLVEKGCR